MEKRPFQHAFYYIFHYFYNEIDFFIIEYFLLKKQQQQKPVIYHSQLFVLATAFPVFAQRVCSLPFNFQ